MTIEQEVAPVATFASKEERQAGIVQAVGRRPQDIERRRWESLAVFGIFLVAYTWLGFWMVTQAEVVGFETLDRFNRALMFWHNDPTKLAAVGFDYPPLSVLLLSPLTIASGLVKNLYVIPLGSSLFAATSMTVLNTMMRRAQIISPVRIALLVGVGVNPLVALYASSGSRDFIWLTFTVVAVCALFAWYVTADIRFVMVSGLAFAISALAGYNSLLYFVISAIAVGAILAKLGADGHEVEGTTVGFASPTVYVVALWTAFNLILVLRPFNWITASSDRPGAAQTEEFSVLDVALYTGKLVLQGAPIAIAVLPMLIFVGVAKSNPFALWLGVILLVSIVTPAASTLLNLTDSPMVLRNALPILMFSVIGACWLSRSSGDRAPLIAGLLVVGLLASIPWTFQSMKTYKYQTIEASFAQAVTTGKTQSGTVNNDGATIGIGSERQMAKWIDDNVDKRNSILTDNAQTYGVMLMTGSPDLFFDRVDKSDGPWLEAARDPEAHVEYLLLSINNDSDLLTEIYPNAAKGTDPSLVPMVATSRYILVSVPQGFIPGQVSGDAESQLPPSLVIQ